LAQKAGRTIGIISSQTKTFSSSLLKQAAKVIKWKGRIRNNDVKMYK